MNYIFFPLFSRWKGVPLEHPVSRLTQPTYAQELFPIRGLQVWFEVEELITNIIFRGFSGKVEFHLNLLCGIENLMNVFAHMIALTIRLWPVPVR